VQITKGLQIKLPGSEIRQLRLAAGLFILMLEQGSLNQSSILIPSTVPEGNVQQQVLAALKGFPTKATRSDSFDSIALSAEAHAREHRFQLWRHYGRAGHGLEVGPGEGRVGACVIERECACGNEPLLPLE
jgi:hypothetical protein